MSDPLVRCERRDDGVAVLRLNRPPLNPLSRALLGQLTMLATELAGDPAVKAVVLVGSEKALAAGADIDEFGGPAEARMVAAGFRAAGDALGAIPRPVIAAISGYALGGGFEMALMSDISVVAGDTKIGMPATRFLGPALGSLHMFFHRLGPVLARRMLLTGDTIEAQTIAHLGVFTETVDDAKVEARADWWARKVARMPADGLVLAKEAFRLVEQLQGYQGEEVASYIFHAFGTNLQFDEGEFNFVKARAEHGAKKDFAMARAHFDIPEP